MVRAPATCMPELGVTQKQQWFTCFDLNLKSGNKWVLKNRRSGNHPGSCVNLR